MDFYGFYTGKIFDAHKYLGAHIRKGKDGKAEGAVFRTFAPSASRISVIGEFNGWTESPMEKVHDGNFWEFVSEKAEPGMMYKYRIYDRTGNWIDHCDPYGYGMELRPNTASIVRDMDAYEFHDEKWLKKRSDHRKLPLNIYELHFGSFKKPSDEPDAWYDYEEMADILIPYLKENGYNYLEIMPLCEYPCDESWGYQGTGFFSPTSRYGTADQLKAFVDACHKNEIGIILDFVPVHFAVDDYALANYDGTALYEYPHSDVGDSEWGSRNFMHSRGEVRSFLQSAAEYWLNEYHMDGLRMDAVSRAIYWQGMPERGVNSNAVEKEGGLGFDYKWDMGWMNDTLDYFRTAPEYRTRDYHKLTFSFVYYYDERYLLPLSHDEVVHGKATILQKMYGDYEQKFPQARAFYMYMYAHPGKKLNFMGNELGHFREWDEKRELDWNLLDYPAHQEFHRFIKELNRFYLEHPAFYEKDYDTEGFEWMECHAEEKRVYVFERRSEKECLIAAFNFSDAEQAISVKPVQKEEKNVSHGILLTRIFSSEYKEYGGQEEGQKIILKPEDGAFLLRLHPFSGAYYKLRP